MGKKLFKELELFLFDMDGLLFDTETIYINYGRKIAGDMGYDLKDSFIEKTIGTTNDTFKELSLIEFGEKFDFDKYCYEVKNYVKEQAIIGNIPLMTGAVEILEYLTQNDKKIVLATSANLNMAIKLTKSKNIDKYFSHMITSDHVSNGKPNPEVFLTGAKKTNIDPKKSMVFEDSFNGIIAAHRAGMYPVMIPDKLKPNDEIKNLYYKEFNTLLDVIKFFEGEI